MDKIKIANLPLGPFPVALVGAEVDDKPNYVTIGACGVVCQEPVMYASLKKTHYTTKGIRKSGYFSINIPSAGMVRTTDYCGIVSGKNTDKSGVFNSFYDELGKAPLIKECQLNFLCEVIRNIDFFDFKMFLGRILAVYINTDCLTAGKADPLKIDPLILMGTSYLDLGEKVGNVYREGKK